MNQYQLTLIARHRPETLERILRVVRHRGFNVVGMNVTLENRKLHIALSVESDRALDLLVHQIAKLIDVDVVNE